MIDSWQGFEQGDQLDLRQHGDFGGHCFDQWHIANELQRIA